VFLSGFMTKIKKNFYRKIVFLQTQQTSMRKENGSGNYYIHQ